MPAQILHTTLIRDRVLAAGGEVFQVDLPVNPLSGIILTARALNNTGTLADYHALNGFAAKYTNLRVTYRGATIINGSLADLAVAMMIRERFSPSQGPASNVNNAVRSLTVPIMFGRRLYDALECFPATRRGDLVLEITAGADAEGLDGHSLQAETIELLDARPERFLKITTITQAIAAMGVNDIELPIGNKLVGCVLHPFAFPGGATFDGSFGEIAFLVDNVEIIEARRNWETAHGMLARRAPAGWKDLEHIHNYDGSAGGDANTDEGQRDWDGQDQYAYLDWDPLDDGQYMIDTRGAAHVQLRMVSDTADGANTSRVLPVELVELKPSQAAG